MDKQGKRRRQTCLTCGYSFSYSWFRDHNCNNLSKGAATNDDLNKGEDMFMSSNSVHEFTQGWWTGLN